MNHLSFRSRRAAAAAGAFAVSLSAAGVASGVAWAEPALTPTRSGVGVLAAAPEVFAGFDNFDALAGTSPRTNTVNLPAGSYSVIAKGTYVNANNDNSAVRCRLTAGGDFDEGTVNARVQDAAVSLAVVHGSSTPFQATLECANIAPTSNTAMRFIKIVATRVNSLQNNSV